MNPSDERASRPRRSVPSVRGMFALVIAAPFAIALAWHYRFAALAWWLSLPSWAFVAMAAVGVAVAAAAIVVAFAVNDCADAGDPEDYAAVADLPPEARS